MAIVQVLVFGLVFGSMIGIAAMGMSVVYEITEVLHFAWAELMMVGALVTLAGTFVGLPFLVAAAVGILASSLLCMTSAELVFKPLYGKGLVGLLLGAIGLHFVFRYGAEFFAGPDNRLFALPVTGNVQIAGTIITARHAITVGLGLLSLAIFVGTLYRTDFGRKLRAIAANPDLAESRGIDTESVTRRMWLFTGAFAGLAGILAAAAQGVSPYIGQQLLPHLFAAIIFGGMGDARGAFAGSLVLGVLIQFTTMYFGSQWAVFVALVVIMGMLVVKPEGIATLWQREGRADIA